MDEERSRGARKRAYAAFAVAGLLLVGNIVALTAFDHHGGRGHGPEIHQRGDMPFAHERDDRRDGDRDGQD